MCQQSTNFYMTKCVFAHACPFSLFERMPHMQDNDLEREFQVHRTESDYALAEFWKWVIACMIGVSMGCIGFAVDWGINLLQNAKYQTTASVLMSSGQSNFSRNKSSVTDELHSNSICTEHVFERHGIHSPHMLSSASNSHTCHQSCAL